MSTSSILNEWTGIGRLVKPIELRTAKNGTPYCVFTIAINGFTVTKDEQPAPAARTIFINCRAFNKTAEAISKYQINGRNMFVKGNLDYDDVYKRNFILVKEYRVI